MAPLGSDQLKSKKIFVSSAITDDELLVGLKTMKAWGVVDKDFPKPIVNAFLTIEDTMNAIRLRIASIEKTIVSPFGNKPDTANTEEQSPVWSNLHTILNNQILH